jgi:ABC-type multidrug transport system ATPase subunit
MAITANALRYEIPLGNGGFRALIDDVSLHLEEGSFTAIIGPSGCGKSTLLKLIAGLINPTAGEPKLAGYDVERLKNDLPLTIGYLPQFASFHEVLTVREILENALALRLPSTIDPAMRASWLGTVIHLTDLAPVLSQTPGTLSGGQLRRLALAEQLVGDPPFLFLDELTSGLDPHSEREMMHWLARVVKETKKTVLLVTHSLSNLCVCDRILFLSRGRLIYDGPPNEVLASFEAPDMEHIYFHSENYAPVSNDSLPPALQQTLRTAPPPGGLEQLGTLIQRQWSLFLRDRGQLILHVLLLFTFPFLVAVFAYRGLPEVRELSLQLKPSIVEGLAEQLEYFHRSFELASLVSGLSMLQVILLALIGANNGAREIAKERGILFKEMRAGLSPVSYLASKFLFVGFLSAMQSLWMTFFVRFVCDFPGGFGSQFAVLFLTTFAMSSTCLWFSSISRTPERASLLAVYSVGLQLPLSGAVLALPQWLSLLTQPVIAAYWGWSGYLRTFENFRHFDVVSQSTKTAIVSYGTSVVVLLAHIGVTFVLTWWSLQRGRTKVSA